MSSTRILVAGIGNIFLGDDAFGVEVAQRLMQRAWPEGVRVADFGIRGFDLAFAMLEDYDLTILVDATPRGGTPGMLYLIEVDPDAEPPQGGELDPHGMNPMRVLQMVKSFGGRPRRLLVVGCEPATFGPEDEGQMGLSEAVAGALDDAVEMVEELVEKERCRGGVLWEASKFAGS